MRKKIIAKESDMKKLLCTVIVVFVCGGLFAAENFIVQTVTGRVEKEVSPGKWVEIKQGDSLDGKSEIRTGINSSLSVKTGSQIAVINALKRGAVGDLASSGIRLTGALERDTGKVSTASARAGDEAEESWSEE
jgi:hypothetical protein